MQLMNNFEMTLAIVKKTTKQLSNDCIKDQKYIVQVEKIMADRNRKDK